MSNPAGNWNVTVATPFGDQEMVLEIVIHGEKVSGSATFAAGGDMRFSGGEYRDDKVTLGMSITTPIKAELKVTLKADGDTISGKARAGLMSFKATGMRATGTRA